MRQKRPASPVLAAYLARTIAWLAAIACWTFATTGYAALAHLYSWVQESEDGQYILVMISPLSADEDARPGGRGEFAPDYIRSIRAKYSQSGLYKNDGSSEPLWTLPYWDWTHEAHIASDGKHVVIADDWHKNHTFHVVTFYRSGQKLSSHYINTLLPSWKLAVILNGGYHVSRAGSWFDGERLTYRVRTNQGDEFLFDITTGQIVSRTSTLRNALSILLILITALTGWWLRRVFCRRNAVGPTANVSR